MDKNAIKEHGHITVGQHTGWQLRMIIPAAVARDLGIKAGAKLKLLDCGDEKFTLGLVKTLDK